MSVAEVQDPEAVRVKMIEVADLLRKNDPDGPLSGRALTDLIREACGGPNGLANAVLWALPETSPGMSRGDYGDRVLEGVRQ